MCTGELQVNIKEVSVGGYRLASCNGAKGERARCTVYWLSHRAPLCPRWAVIVPADKALIQHILSPRERSGNRRRRPSPPFPPTYPLLLSLPPSVSISLSHSLASNVVAGMHQRELQNNARGQPGIWRAFFKNRNFIRQSSIISWVDHLASHRKQKPTSEKNIHLTVTVPP